MPTRKSKRAAADTGTPRPTDATEPEPGESSGSGDGHQDSAPDGQPDEYQPAKELKKVEKLLRAAVEKCPEQHRAALRDLLNKFADNIS